MEDITKTGPIGLKGIRVNNNNNNNITQEEYDSFISSFVPSSRIAATLKAESLGRIAQPYDISTGIGVGTSRYDEAIYTPETIERAQDIRAENQSALSKLLAGTAKGEVLAGTTFLDGTVGFIAGAINGISQLADDSTKTGFWEGFWNNDFSKAMQEVNNWAEENLPNYYTQQEEENNKNGEWYKNMFTANWWGNSFIKNLGFIAGAFATGNLVSSALKGAPSMVKSLVGSTISAINEGKIEALNTADEWYNYEESKLTDARNKELMSIDQYKSNPDLYSELVQSINNTYEESLAKLNEDKAKVGNVAFALNTALLTGTNSYMWGKLYGGGSKTAIGSMNIAKRNGKYVSESTPIKALTGFISEGTEEIAQKTIAIIPGLKYESELENFYMSKWDPESSREALDWAKSISKGIADTVGDSSSWEEFTIGAMTGVLGMPVFRSTRTSEGKWRSPVTLEGGSINDYREYRENKRKEKSLVNKLNERVNSPDFRNYYEGMIRHNKYQKDMNNAAEIGDEFAYKNAEDSQLISDIIMFDNAGRLNDIIEEITTAFDISDSNIQSLVQNTTDEYGNGPFSENGNALPKEEIVSKIKDSKNTILKQIEDYRKIKRHINKNIGDIISDEQLSELTWLGAKVSRTNDRFKELIGDIKNDLRSYLSSVDVSNPSNKTVTESINKLLSLDNDSFAYNIKELTDVEIQDPSADSLDIKINDLIKIQKLREYTESKYKEYIENPAKQQEDKQKIQDKNTKIAENTNNIKRKDDINRNSISNLNKNIDEGIINIEELESLIPEGFNPEEATSTQEKAFEVINMQKDKKRIKDAISNSNVDEQTKDDALNLFNANFALSESSNELTDLSSEAINDINNMVLEDDPSITQLSSDPEALEEALNLRHLKAKSLLSQVVRTIKNEDESLKNIPLKNPILSLSSQDVIGNDAIEKQVPINTPKNDTSSLDSIIAKMLGPNYKLSDKANLKEVLSNIQNLFDSGADKSYLINTIMDTKSFKDLSSSIPSIINDLSDYVNNLYVNEEVSQETIVDMYNPNMTDDDPTNHTEILNKNNVDYNKEDNNEVLGIHESWLSPLSYYSRMSKDFTSTFADFVESTNRYSDEKKKRILAIWDYLDNHNVFKYIDNNGVKVGDKVIFTTDNSLNDSAGELVIIMKANDQIIGVLPSENDAEFNTYIGLSEFVSSFKEKYNNQGNPDGFTFGSTTINKNMVGKIPYSSVTDTNTLNAISTETTSSGDITYKPILLGISAGEGKYAPILTSGARKSSGKSALEKSIMSPLNAIKGQPYMLIETSDPKRKYVPIPFLMDPYSREHENTALGKAINKVLESLQELSPKDVMKAKTIIQELLAIPELHINFTKEGNLKIDYKPKDSNRQITIYNGSQNNPELVQSIKDRLYGTPYQVSRKYINGIYKGQNYNNMIGEIARTNLPIGTTHTVDDWFNVNRVDKEGNEVKSRPIKSIINSTPSPKESYYTDTYKDINIKVNLETFEVTDDKGKTYNGPRANVYKAKAYGYKNKITEGIIQTEWGTFNLDTEQFVEESSKPEGTVVREFSFTPESSTNEIVDYDEQARKKGFLNSAKRKAMWNALNSFQKEAVLNKIGLEQKQILINLDRAFNVSDNTFDSKKLGNKSLDEYLNTKPLFRKVDNKSLKEIKESELKWMQENLPNLSSDDRIKVVDGLIKISDEEGFAYGQFINGIITLSNKASRGTIYHEAFHSVVHTLLNNSEREYLLKEAKDKYGDLSEIELEENLAESFRRYMQIEEIPFVGRAVNIFRKLKHILNNLFGKESYLDKIYYNINNKVYADRIPGITSVSRNMTVEQFQGIVDSNINNERLYPKNKVSDIHNAWGKLIDNWIRKGYEIKGTFDKKTKNYKVKSVTEINTLRDDLINIEQYHIDKLSFGNLSKEDQQYIINRGLSIEEYNKMSKFEREVFLHCRH